MVGGNVKMYNNVKVFQVRVQMHIITIIKSHTGIRVSQNKKNKLKINENYRYDVNHNFMTGLHMILGSRGYDGVSYVNNKNKFNHQECRLQ